MAFNYQLTTIGQSRIAAAVSSGTPVAISYLALGSGDGTTLTPASTGLNTERTRIAVGTISVVNGIISITTVIPRNVGGWNISEIGLISAANELIAFAPYPTLYKPGSSEITAFSLTITSQLVVANTSAITINVTVAAPANPQQPIFLGSTTSLTGGGANAMDAVPTVGLQLPRLFHVSISDAIQTFKLRAEGSGETPNGTTSFRPTDYNASTNKVIYIELA